MLENWSSKKKSVGQPVENDIAGQPLLSDTSTQQGDWLKDILSETLRDKTA